MAGRRNANLHQALAWCLGHDPAAALRLAVALAPWWMQRGRFTDGYTWLQAAAGHRGPDDPAWCTGQVMLGEMAQDLREALDHNSAALSAAGPHGESPLHADALNGQAACLLNLRQIPEGEESAHRALAMSRHLGYRAGEVLALVNLAEAARFTGQVQEALEWQRQAGHIDPAEIPGRRMHERSQTLVKALSDAGDMAGAQRVCADGLAQSTETHDLASQIAYLAEAASLDLQTGQLAAAGQHLGQVIELALRTGYRLPLISCLDTCGYLCAQTGRPADALTVWVAYAAWLDQEGFIDLPQDLTRRQEAQDSVLAVLGSARARAAQERGQAMTLKTAAEYALLLSAAEPPSAAPELSQLSPREQELVTLVAQGHTDGRSRASCLSASVPSVRIRTGYGTRPAAAAAPI